MPTDKLVSIIIRTRNEERWITQCLEGVFAQGYRNFEVIVIDNESADKTIEKARRFAVGKIATCREYRPGKALNMGIGAAKGEYIVSLSGHCIPVNNKWLGNLIKNFDDQKVAGVYGRQEALDFTSDYDKRDLALVFGLDRKVQVKDSFFHNANSMIRRSVWEKEPFDENLTNIEDRVWAERILRMGYSIIYEPEASVYHYHGIHQDQNMERCKNVVKILNNLHKDYEYKSMDIDKMNIIALIPVRGNIQYLENKPLMAYTIERALESKYIKRIIVSTDSAEMAELANKLGAETPFLRDASFSRDYVDLGKVFQHSLERVEEAKIFPDLVICLEVTFPFRPKGLIDDMILQLAQNGLDTVVAARAENRALWKERDGRIEQLVEGMTPRQFKESVFIELKGVGCVTHPEFLRQGALLGKKIGIYEVDDPYSHLEVRNEDDFRMASRLIKEWFNK